MEDSDRCLSPKVDMTCLFMAQILVGYLATWGICKTRTPRRRKSR